MQLEDCMLGDLGLGWEPMAILPLGDLQYGPETCDVRLLKDTIEWSLEEEAYYIGLGDMVDVMSPSNRKALVTAGFYDSVTDFMEKHGRQLEGELMKVLEPTKSRWLGMVHGHHYFPYGDGSTTDTHLAEYLGCPYLGTSAMLRLFFRDRKQKAMCTVFVHHGVGSGNPISKLEKTAGWADADLLLMGHYHKRMPASLPRLSVMGPPGKPTLVDRERKLVCTGSYLKGYMQDSRAGGLPRGSYVEERMLVPVSLGSPMVYLTPIRKNGISQVEIKVVS